MWLLEPLSKMRIICRGLLELHPSTSPPFCFWVTVLTFRLCRTFICRCGCLHRCSTAGFHLSTVTHFVGNLSITRCMIKKFWMQTMKQLLGLKNTHNSPLNMFDGLCHFDTWLIKNSRISSLKMRQLFSLPTYCQFSSPLLPSPPFILIFHFSLPPAPLSSEAVWPACPVSRFSDSGAVSRSPMHS